MYIFIEDGSLLDETTRDALVLILLQKKANIRVCLQVDNCDGSGWGVELHTEEVQNEMV